MSPEASRERSGAGYALAAYTFWGVAPVYFVLVEFAFAFEVLAHRILWSLPVLAVLLTALRQWPMLRGLSKREYGYLLASSLCLGINWWTFIYAIHDDNIAETSLGYYINPLVSLMLGWLVLRERLRPLQWFAVMFVVIGIGNELVVERMLPLYGLALAFSFGFYGLLRKQVNLPSAVGLSVETAFAAPIAALYLIWLSTGSDAVRDTNELALLALGGIVTVTPLIWFAAAAVRLPLTTLSFFQYLAPSLSLLLAVFVYDEAVSAMRWFTMGMIWVALVIFSFEGLYHHRQTRMERVHS